ncbi:uncharacterized protein LOC119796535 [Cyprinodon tularosa]|uniref:uncharacterized protein LOC119796535 n=1 Tax=Cyprinodon tularosa TaxID=77115 RepID=UPI0018E26B7C|nr:uncharacterized protein LOC119796535 [Cyprinodon tularosa]
MINGDVMDEGAGNQAAEPALDPPPDHSSDEAMDTDEHPGGEKNQKQDQPGDRLNSKVKEMDNYRIKCPSCNLNFSPSFQFTMEKGRHCEFNIDLQKESKNDNTDCTNEKLELKNQSADIEVKCPNCEHSFLYKAIAKKNIKTDGFDIEFSIETPGANDTKGQSKKEVETEDSLLKCTTCKNDVGTSVNFSMEKNGPCKFNICLYNGSDNTVLTSHELTLGNKPASAELNCPKCKQFLRKSNAKRINKRDGFDIELSINKTEEDQLEGRAGDNQPTSQIDFGKLKYFFVKVKMFLGNCV